MSMIPLMKGGFGKDGSYLLATGFSWVQLMARAKPGFSMQQAQASLDVALNAATRGTMAVGKDETVPHLLVEDGSKGSNFLGEVYAKPLYVLLAMVAFVLLLACANMANLMLARASVRQREMGVRLALGAGHWRILRQVLTESLLLSVIGGALGLLLGYLARTTLPSLVAYGWDSVQIHVPFNWRVFSFTAGITIATGILFGIAPAWAATRAEIGTALKQGSRTATYHRKAWSGKAIVGFQVALSTLLVVGAGLFLRTLINLNSIDPGFRADHLLLFDVNPPNQRYPGPKDIALHMRLEDALRAVPGVEGVTLSDVPLLSGFMSNESFYVEGVPAKKSTDTEHSPVPDIDHVGSSFFSVMGIPLLAGRSFTAQDSETSQQVSVINQALARKYFANQNPIGKRFSDSGPGSANRKFTTIIGVSADSRYDTLRNDPPPLHFDLYRQMTEIGGATYMVRTRMKPEAIVSSLRAAVQRIDRDLPLMDVRTQQQQIDGLTQQERMFACLTSGFGVLAVALACVGIYGIMAYTVAQRTNEIGIRLALGAERKQVRRTVLREASGLALVGVVSGLLVALALGRLVKSLLYGLQPADPVSLAAAAALLLTVALIAGWIPALRASLVEPMEALRHE
jgi:predicted permease